MRRDLGVRWREGEEHHRGDARKRLGRLLDVDRYGRGNNIDYAQLIKIYGEGPKTEARYSPAQCMGARKAVISGAPEHEHVSTSHIERQNLTLRMSNRRFTRLTNAFSKKVENHEYSVALHFMHYNFCRVHQTLRVTPAMEAGLTDHVWSIAEIIALIDSEDAAAAA
jgi:hypothetical protein